MTIISKITNKVSKLKVTTKKFIEKISKGILCAIGKINFRNVSRYVDISEKTISRNYKDEKLANITELNVLAIEEVYKPENKNILVLDASFIKKSGKKTYGKGKFWDGKNSKVSKGLEISLLALVDTTYKTAYAINATQTTSELKEDETRIDYYLKQLKDNKDYFKEITHLGVDGFYSKKKFLDGAIELHMNIISKLRCDADLKYLYQGDKTGKKGAPRKYDGKVDLKNHKFDYVITLIKGEKLYTSIVYSSSLKRKIKIVLVVNKESKQHIFYSTDLNLSALDIFDYYSSRFQIEYLFRDSKGFTGLEDCQSTNENILNTHFNMSFFVLNSAKIEDRILKGEENTEPFSMLSYKRRASNLQMLNLFIHKFDIDLTSNKMASAYHDLIQIGSIAC